MKILLLGGDGFVGFNLLESLDLDCTSMCRTPSIFRKNFDNFIRANPYEDAIKKSYDVYINLIDNKNPKNKEENILKNIPEKSHVILFSSAVIYANPNSEYGVRKLKTEKIYQEFCEKNKINLTILRLFNIYGKYQVPYRQGSLIANILYNHINDIPININDIDVTRDFIFAEDVSYYIKYIIENSIYGTYDLATGKMYSVFELLKIIEEITADKLNIINHRKKDIPCQTTDNLIPCKIENTELKLGIEKTYGFFKENNKQIRSLLE